MSRTPAWSTTEDDRLRTLARSGLSLTEIKAQMPFSATTIRARALKLNIALARDLNGAQKSARIHRAKVK